MGIESDLLNQAKVTIIFNHFKHSINNIESNQNLSQQIHEFHE